MDDESSGRVADVIERIAGHQRDRRLFGVGERRRVGRVDDLDARDPIAMQLQPGADLDEIAATNVFQRPEESVAMTRNAEVAAPVR